MNVGFTAIDEAPISGFHRKLAVACGGGPLLDGYLLGIVGLALTGITVEMRLSPTTEAVVGVAALVGMFFGGLIFGPITDQIGRRTMYTLDLSVLITAAALSAFVTSSWQLIALRFVVGVAIAADYPIATALLSEWLPRRHRARIFTSATVVWYMGTALAYLVGSLIGGALGASGWRWMLASAAVLGIVVFGLRLGAPESPRWLVAAGRIDEACGIVERTLHTPVTSEQLRGLESDPDVVRGNIVELFRGIYLRRMVFVVIFFSCAIIPLFALLTFGPRLLGSLGLGPGNPSNLGMAVINIVFALGCLPVMRWLDTVGRRTTIIWSFALMVMPLFALATWTRAPSPLVLGFFCLYAMFSGAPNILEWGYPNELFPTHLRASAVGMVIALTRFGAVIGTFLVPLSLTRLGTSLTMYIGAGVTFLGLLACLAWAEETRNRSLEETGADSRSHSTIAAGAGGGAPVWNSDATTTDK